MAPVDLELIDRNEALYHTQWPKMGSTKEFADAFCRSYSKSHSCCIIFDKIPGSIKSYPPITKQRCCMKSDYTGFYLGILIFGGSSGEGIAQDA